MNDEAAALLFSKGERAVAKGDLDEALSAFQEMVDKFPTSPLGYLALSQLLKGKGELMSARDILISGTQVITKEAELFTQLGRVYQALGSLEEALHSLRHALNIDPSNKRARQIIQEILGFPA